MQLLQLGTAAFKVTKLFFLATKLLPTADKEGTVSQCLQTCSWRDSKMSGRGSDGVGGLNPVHVCVHVCACVRVLYYCISAFILHHYTFSV